MRRYYGLLSIILCAIGLVVSGCSDDSVTDGGSTTVSYSLIAACESQNGNIRYMLEIDIGTGISLDSMAMPFSEPPFSFLFSQISPNVYWSVPTKGIFSLLQTTWPVTDTIASIDSTGGELTFSPDEAYIHIPGALLRVPGLTDVYDDPQDQFGGVFVPGRHQYVYQTLQSNTLHFIDYGLLPITTISDTLIGAPYSTNWIKSIRPTITGDSLILSAQYFNDSLLSYFLVVDTDSRTVLDTVMIPAGISAPDMVPVLHPDGRRMFWVQGFTLSPPDNIVFMYRLDTGQFEVVLDQADVGELIAYQLLLVPGGRDLLVIGTGGGVSNLVSRVIRIDLMGNSVQVLREFPAGISISSAAIRIVIEEN